MQSPHVTGSGHSVALDQQICQSNLSSEKKIAYLIFRGRVSKRVSFQSLPIFFPFSVVKKRIAKSRYWEYDDHYSPEITAISNVSRSVTHLLRISPIKTVNGGE